MVLLMNNEDKEISTNLTLSDLKLINNIIDLVSSKGLFRPSDYNVIGTLYEKIVSILKEQDDKK